MATKNACELLSLYSTMLFRWVSIQSRMSRDRPLATTIFSELVTKQFHVVNSQLTNVVSELYIWKANCGRYAYLIQLIKNVTQNGGI